MKTEGRKTILAQLRISFDNKRRVVSSIPRSAISVRRQNIDKIHLTAGRYLLVTSYTPAYFVLSYNCNHLVSYLISDFQCVILPNHIKTIHFCQIVEMWLESFFTGPFPLALTCSQWMIHSGTLTMIMYFRKTYQCIIIDDKSLSREVSLHSHQS